MHFQTSAVFLLQFLAFGRLVSSEDASQSTPGVWESDSVDAETSPTSEQEINITHELVRESIVQSTTERSDVTTTESDLNNMSKNITIDNNLSKDNRTKKIVANDIVSNNDIGDDNISNTDGEDTNQHTTESIPIDLERTTITNFLTTQETTIFPPKDVSLQDSSTVQNSGQMVTETKAKSTRTEDSISSDDQSSSSTRDSTTVSEGNVNDHNEGLQTSSPIYENNRRLSGQRKSDNEDYLFSDKPKSIDLLRIFKLILEKQTLDLDSKILDMMQSVESDGNSNWNAIYNAIALCLKSKGLSAGVYKPPQNWYNPPIPLLPPDMSSKPAFYDTFIYDTEINPLAVTSTIDHLRPCWKTQKNCFSLGGKVLCKRRVVCRPSAIKDQGPIWENGFYNLDNAISNLEDGIPNLESSILSLKNAIPFLKIIVPLLKSTIPFFKNTIPFFKNTIPGLPNAIPIFKKALLLRKEQSKDAGYEDEMDGVDALLRLLMEVEEEVQNETNDNKMINSRFVDAKILSDAVSQTVKSNPHILGSKGSLAKITSGTIAAHPTIVSNPTYANPINDASPIFGTNTIDDATRRFITNPVNPAQVNKDNLNSLNQLLNNLNNLNTLNSYINAESVSGNGDHLENIEGRKVESIENKEADQRALTSEPITGGIATLPTLSVSTKPLSVSVNQSVLNEMTPTSKSVEPVESGPVATAKQFETVYPSIDQLVSHSNQPNEGSVSDSDENAHRASLANSLVNKEYQSGNLETKVGNINTNLDGSVNTNLNRDLNINTISNTNKILNPAGMNSSGISVDNSFGNIRQSLTTKPETANSQHVSLNLNQGSNVNINQDENVSKLERGSIQQQFREPIKMQLPESAQAEHLSPVAGNTRIAGRNAKQDDTLNENRNPNTNVNQNVNANQVNIAGLTRGLNPLLGSSDMSVNPNNDINRNIPDGNSNIVGNVGLSRRTNSDPANSGFKDQQISEVQTLPQGVSVGDAGATNANLNYNANVNRDYNVNLRQGDSLKMSESIRDIPTPTQSSNPVAQVQQGGKMNTNSDNNDGVKSKFKAHANFKLNLGRGFDMIKNVLTQNPLLSGGIISRRIMNLPPKDQNLQGEVPIQSRNENQNESQNLNLNQNQNFNQNQVSIQSQNANQVQNSEEYSNHNLNEILNVNLNQNQYQSQNQIPNQLPKQNNIPHQSQFLNQNQNSNQNLRRNMNGTLHNDEYSNQNLNQELKQNINLNLNQNQLQDQIPSQKQVHNRNTYQDSIPNLNTNQNQNLIDNGYQNQIQKNNLIKEQNTNQYLSQNYNQNSIQDLSRNMNQYLSQNLNQNQNQYQNEIQIQSQSSNEVANQHFIPNENQNVNQNFNHILNQNQNQNPNMNQILNQFPKQDQFQHQSQHLNQNLRRNMNETLHDDEYSNQNLNQELKQNINPNLNQNQLQDQIQSQKQVHNRNTYQDSIQNLNTNQNQNLNDNGYQNQIQNHNLIKEQNMNQYLSQNYNENLNHNQNQYQNEIQIQSQSNNVANQHFIPNENLNINQNFNHILNQNQNPNMNQILNQNPILKNIQNQYFKQDQRRNFNQNQNLDQTLAQNMNQNPIQTSDVIINDKSQEKQKGWYELWYNDGEGKDDWTEIWNNKRFKRFRRETNHRRLRTL